MRRIGNHSSRAAACDIDTMEQWDVTVAPVDTQDMVPKGRLADTRFEKTSAGLQSER